MQCLGWTSAARGLPDFTMKALIALLPVFFVCLAVQRYQSHKYSEREIDSKLYLKATAQTALGCHMDAASKDQLFAFCYLKSFWGYAIHSFS